MTSPRLAYLNILSRDPEKLASFYQALFGFAEIQGHRSPIYRCLDAGGSELGFNAEAAYDLLGISDRHSAEKGPVRVYPTFELPSAEAVHEAARQANDLGGQVIKPPYTTYYNAVQAVLEDPEGNVLRVNHRMGPRLPADEVASPPWQKG